MPIQTNICLNCKEPIKKGRSDKKFCDSGCKDEYYNEIKIREGREIRKVIAVLKKNRKALQKLYNPQKSDKLFSREALIKAGFEFGFTTHTVITKAKSNEIIFCLDYGYREVSEGKYQLFPSFSKVQVKDGSVFEIN